MATITAYTKTQVDTFRASDANTYAKAVPLHREPALKWISKAKTGPFRVLAFGTSITSFDNSSVRLLSTWLQAQYGASRFDHILFGVDGGTYTAGVNGWTKQRYGGAQFTRERGSQAAGASTLTYYGYFDSLVLETSRETDAAPATVAVDGATIGTTPAAGAQTYRNQITATVPLGFHTVTITPPVTGYAYLETMELRDSTRRVGVEWLDFTMGGAGLWNTTGLMADVAGQDPATPISGTNGLDYYFTRTDVDLYLIAHNVNDRTHPTDFTANAAYAIGKAQTAGIPIVFIIEPMQTLPVDAGYQTIRSYLLAQRSNPWVTVIDWHGAIWPGDVTDNSQLALFQSLYFPNGELTHPDQRAYDVLTPLLARELGVLTPTEVSESALTRTQRRAWDGITGVNTVGSLAGKTYQYGRPDGVASPINFPDHPASTRAFPAPVPYYRLPLPYGANIVRDQQVTLQAGSTDQFGTYLDWSNTVFPIQPAAGVTYRVTAKVGGLFRVRFTTANMVVLGSSGATLPANITGTITELLDPNLGTAGTDAPTVLTWLVKGVDGTNANTVWTGRFYDLTMTVADQPVLDSSAGAYGNLNLTPYQYTETFTRPVSALVDGLARRYAQPVGAAYEYLGVNPLFPYNYTGQAVPLYRDTRAVNWAAGASTDIAASTTSDAAGTYLTMSNTAYHLGDSGVSGKEYQLTVRARGNFTVRIDAGQNAYVVADGVPLPVDVNNRTFAYFNGPSTPYYFTMRIQTFNTSQPAAYFSGAIYGIWATDSTVPLLTT